MSTREELRDQYQQLLREREHLIADGVDPAALVVPLDPDSIGGPR